MQWEQLTSYDLAKAVDECQGVAIVPVGVLEAHASHLPLGTDMFTAHWQACRAAEKEPAVVFPAYPYGINHETAHLPGGIVFKRELVFALLENVCDEISRNGFKKIIFLSGHGGNRYFLPLFVQTLVEKEKPYLVYDASLPYFPEMEDVLETDETGHACEWETSLILHIAPELVKMDQVPEKPFTSLKRNQPLSEAGGYSPMDWYAMYPVMYVGDASKATAEKGEKFMARYVEGLVKLIQAVKADETTPELYREFLAKKQNPGVPDEWAIERG